RVARVQPFAPQQIVPSEYEGKAVATDPAIVPAMAAALQRVHQLQATPLGVSLDAPIQRAGTLGSPLGNLFAAALRAAVPGADVAAVNNATRGLRTDLPEGPVTFGEIGPQTARGIVDGRHVRARYGGAECRRKEVS